MKKVFISILFVLVPVLGMLSQVPGSFQYQAVIRNNDGSVMSDCRIDVKVRIFQGTPDGKAVYEEQHETSSNSAGVVTLKIGEGMNSSRKTLFADVDWSAGDHFMETLIDRYDGAGFVSVGTQQLLSVPYAKCAVNAQNVHVKSADGKLWRIKVSNDGTVSAEAVTE